MAAAKAKKSSPKKLKTKTQPVNKWIIILGVTVIAAVGALVIRFSGASSYSFINNYTAISGGYTQRINNIGYKVIGVNTSLASSQKAVSVTSTGPYHSRKNGGAKICSEFRLLSSRASVRIKMNAVNREPGTSSGFTGQYTDFRGKNSPFTICGPTRLVSGEPHVTVEVNYGSIAVRKVYGQR